MLFRCGQQLSVLQVTRMITQKANLLSSLAGMGTKTQWLVWNICRGVKVLYYYLLLRTARPGSGHWMASTLECSVRLAAMYRLFQSFCERGDDISLGGWLAWLAGRYAGACAMNCGEDCFVFSSSFQGVFRVFIPNVRMWYAFFLVSWPRVNIWLFTYFLFCLKEEAVEHWRSQLVQTCRVRNCINECHFYCRCRPPFVLKFVLFPFVVVFQENLGRGEGQRKEKNSRSHWFKLYKF